MRNLRNNFLLVLGSFIIVFCVLEGLLRLSTLFSSPPLNQHSLCCKHHPLLGWYHVPNKTIKFGGSEYYITQHFNTRGVRGPEYSYEKPPGEYRIVVLGDSFAEGYTVEFKELFSEILKQKLNKQVATRFEVINLGVAGYSTDQELLLFQEVGKQYHPDLTILMFHDNDVWYNGQSRYLAWGRGFKPRFRLEGEELLLTDVPVPLSTPPSKPKQVATIVPDGASISIRIKAAIANNSHLYRWIRERIKNSAEAYSLAIVLGIAEPPETKDKVTIPKEYEVYRRVYTTEVRDAWAVTRRLIANLKEEARGVGSDFLVFHVPMRATIYLEDWVKIKGKYGLTEKEWSINQVNKELEEGLGQLEITFFNPMEQMRQSVRALAGRGARLYFKRDGHWNRIGNQWVGELLAKFILKHYRVTEVPASPS